MSNDQKAVRHGGALKLRRSASFGEVSFEPLMSLRVQNQTPKDRATPPYITTYILGDAANSASKPSRRGGARNRADRESHALTVSQIANLIAATPHAERIGLPFTRMVTIHWHAAGVSLDSMAKATGRFLDLLSKTLARHESETAWIWVHENGRNKGGHCHLLAHVPPALVSTVTRLQKRWLRRIVGKPYRSRVIRSRPIGGRLGVECGNPALHAANLEASLRYVLKGADAEAAALFTLDNVEPGGRIIGKRCGTSQNIGPKARKACRK
ncbi:MAG: hypothetical protein KDD85_12100 [Parvularculaceae bacterium]|nr:hypothetical protein [Parvularculaceae bacterium]